MIATARWLLRLLATALVAAALRRLDRLLLLAALVAVASLAAQAADENRDLDLIPDAAGTPSPPAAASAPATDTRERVFLENATTAFFSRGGLAAPPPGAPPPEWQERLFLDARLERPLTDTLGVTYSGRFNLMAQDDITFPSHGNVRNDFREGFATWQPVAGNYLELGRINLKSGVAAGYNPTDFLKTRAVVDRISQDPASLRENRLGTFMLLGQTIREAGSLSIAYAPALYDHPSALYPPVLPSFDPMFDRTNAHNRVLIKGSTRLPGDLDPEALVYHEGTRTRVGASLSRGFGQSTVGYVEWAGGEQASLISEALAYGRQTGTLPAGAPSPIPSDPHAHFQNDVAIGASYATETRITLNLEYHYHQADFSDRDWRHWFAAGAAAPFNLAVTGPLWFIRSYALDQQEPVGRHSAFLRADWVDAFVPKLELAGFADIDLHDGSTLLQLTADYYLSNAWTIGALATANLGDVRSERGSLAQAGSVLVRLVRYF
ncbi:MAG: hypothetical protein JO021_15035 [Alphaproteobacteria bacterium]|nr:hypothetical protein [Alphaproteobacteria bacterium]